jgi:hypothetical protein
MQLYFRCGICTNAAFLSPDQEPDSKVIAIILPCPGKLHDNRGNVIDCPGRLVSRKRGKSWIGSLPDSS